MRGVICRAWSAADGAGFSADLSRGSADGYFQRSRRALRCWIKLVSRAATVSFSRTMDSRHRGSGRASWHSSLILTTFSRAESERDLVLTGFAPSNYSGRLHSRADWLREWGFVILFLAPAKYFETFRNSTKNLLHHPGRVPTRPHSRAPYRRGGGRASSSRGLKSTATAGDRSAVRLILQVHGNPVPGARLDCFARARRASPIAWSGSTGPNPRWGGPFFRAGQSRGPRCASGVRAARHHQGDESGKQEKERTVDHGGGQRVRSPVGGFETFVRVK